MNNKIKANFVGSYSNAKNAGDFWFLDAYNDGDVYLHFICPCGCNKVIGIPLGEKWTFNGDKINPSINPSIQVMTGCKFHGFLINGEFIF